RAVAGDEWHRDSPSYLRFQDRPGFPDRSPAQRIRRYVSGKSADGLLDSGQPAESHEQIRGGERAAARVRADPVGAAICEQLRISGAAVSGISEAHVYAAAPGDVAQRWRRSDLRFQLVAASRGGG